MSNSEENKTLVRDCFEKASQGNFDALDDIVAPGYILHRRRSAAPRDSSRWSSAIATR